MKLITGITNGKPEDLTQFYENCKFFEGKKVDITVELHKKKRSDLQNSYYWGVVLPKVRSHLCKKLNQELSIKDVHHIVKKYFIGSRKVNLTDRVEEIPISTTTLSTLEFVEFTDRIKTHFAEDGLIIPDPDQKDFLDNEEKNS